MRKGIVVLGAVLAWGCGGPAGPSDELKAQVVANYAEVVYANYDASVTGVEGLASKIDAFVAAPDAAGFQAARQAWLDNRDVYGQTEGFRFYGGPIDNEETGPEGLINAWPMDEVWVDYTRDNPTGGLINSDQVLTRDLLIAQNEKDGEKNISTGYHAVEFLLWGQDNADASDGKAGQRPYTDYVADMGTAMNQARRGEYLKLSTSLLVGHLAEVRDAWAPDADNYRKTFVAAAADDSLVKIFNGIGNLSGGELAGERMEVALENVDQEDEHSCFSDNTHKDVLANAQSIENIYLGKYGSVDGPGLDELVEVVDSALNARIKTELAASIAAAKAIPVPFDKALGTDDGKAKIQATIDALRTQTASIVEAADKLGYTLNLE